MKIILKILLVVAIGALIYMCVQSITTPINFDKEQKERERAIVERLIEIRKAQIGYRNRVGSFAGSFEELQKFLNEDRIPFLAKEGELTDEQLKSGMTEQEAVNKGLIRSPNYDVASLGKVPGFENHNFSIDTTTLTSPSGYVVPVFECGVLYDVYLGDMNKQLLINQKDRMTKLGRYLGLRVGSVTEINNNAGNWE